MAAHDNRNFEKYLKLCGNRFSAVVFVAAEARRLAEKYENIITHAEALSWILSGVVPQGVKRYKETIEQRSLRPLKFAQDHLSNILDEAVKSSVWKSLQISRQQGHLIYYYQEVYDKPRQTRVRVLTNMLWYQMQENELNNNIF